MGKKKGSKGKGASRALDSAAPPAAFNKKASRVRAIETFEDAMGGDEDQFHTNRDTINFEDGGNNDNGMDVSDDDEIFGLNLPESDSSAGEEEAAEDDDDLGSEDEEEEDALTSYPTPLPEAARGRFAKVANPSQDVISDGSDAEDAASASDSEEETWAANSYHATRKAPGEPDSEDDEALGMEAEEARRLQKKAKGLMAGDDFGFGDEGEGDEGVEEVREKARKSGKLEDGVDGGAEGKKEVAGEAMSEEEAIAFLLKKNPETLALLDDFTETAERIKVVEKNLEVVRNGGKDGKDHPALAIMELEHQAITTYLPTLAFYFSLLLTASPSPDLVTKVLDRLSTLRSALATMEELDLTSGQLEDSEDDDESDSDEDDEEEGESMLASDMWDLGAQAGSSDEEEDLEEMLEGESEEDSEEESGEEGGESMLGGLDDDELEAIMDEMDEDATADELMVRVDAYRREKFGLPPADGGSVSDDEEEENASTSAGSKRRRIDPSASSSKTPRSKKSKLSTPSIIPTLAPLSTKSSSSSRPKKSTTPTSGSDYLDPTSLSLTDLSDKASKRHTLRFHVSQIHQKQVKRESGGKNRVGGDEDLPRRSKERSRREVLKRQEHGGAAGEALDGEEWGEGDLKTARGVKGDDGDGEYYDLVKSEKEGGKREKQAKYDDARMAEKYVVHSIIFSAILQSITNLAHLTHRQALDAEGDASAAGPRGVTRKILANKGLQPKRAKINRNSRVKKRVQYDKAVKKVATMKSVYKGGQATLGHGEYMGEKSGIGKGVVKSVRLGGKK
ncbi:U3 small nucleolar RNA-associated protein 3, partial [Phenoliferia sp. Uapishka_3]